MPASSGDLKTFQLFACSLRSGLSLFMSASLSFTITASKSAVLSGLMKLRTIPASDANTRLVGGAACAAGAAACCADGTADRTPNTSNAIQPARPPVAGVVGERNITASLAKGLLLYRTQWSNENGHHLVGKKHSATREPEARPIP